MVRKRRRRFVFDTNVLISSLLTPGGEASEAVKRANRVGHLLLSYETFAELKEVLYRPQFDTYVTNKERRRFIIELLGKTVRIHPKEEITACTDPDDDKFLEVALSGKAECIVTRNLDDYPSESYRDVAIVTPGEFLARIV